MIHSLSDRLPVIRMTMKCLLVLSLGMLMLSVVASYVSDLGRTQNYNFVLVCLSAQSFHSILVNNNKKVLLNNLVLNKFIFHPFFFKRKLSCNIYFDISRLFSLIFSTNTSNRTQPVRSKHITYSLQYFHIIKYSLLQMKQIFMTCVSSNIQIASPDLTVRET